MTDLLVDVVPQTRAILPQDHYTYSIPQPFLEMAHVGHRVQIPFGAKSLIGLVVARRSWGGEENLKPIESVIDETPLLSQKQLQLAQWVAAHYCSPLGEVIKAMLPKNVRTKTPSSRKSRPRTESEILRAVAGVERDHPLPLTPAQQVAVAAVTRAVQLDEHRRFLLHGVTGSGKTEVYLQAIQAAVAKGRQAIVLVPEIALTPQTMRRFAARFGERVSVLHSALTDSERAQQWRRICGGDVDVVVGSRSAVFAPVVHAGLIIADEEDSGSYKQDRIPRYHAIDTAYELGRLHNAPVVVGSATPRVETYFAAHTGAMELLELPTRINERPMPEIELVDLRKEFAEGNRSVLSRRLQKELARCHADGGQAILFLNRRGSSPQVTCRQCGTTLACASCSVSMVYHHSRRRCDCHYCGASRPLPERCEQCGSAAIKQMGVGTERLEADLAEMFPAMRLLRMDRDTVATRDAYFHIYESFRKGDADCLIGTQMVAKGWDLANVRLVGIINADTALHFPDYRSGEVTFSLLTQVAGRAGRGDESASVILQTYSPDHYAIGHALTHDYLNFARDEIRFRKLLKFPPYSQLVTFTMTGLDDDKVHAEADRVAAGLAVEFSLIHAAERPDLLGPSAAYIHRLRGSYRWQITVRGRDLGRLQALWPRGRGWSIDVDPGI